MDHLLSHVRNAVAESIEHITSSRPNETLSGYAICTDDCVMTVFGVATTTEWCQKKSPDLGFIPVEWPYGYNSNAFDEALSDVQKRYADASADDTFAKHVKDTFSTLVEALRLEKADGRFSPDVFLLVTSTDPGPRLQRLATNGAKLLNSPELFQKFKKVYSWPDEG